MTWAEDFDMLPIADPLARGVGGGPLRRDELPSGQGWQALLTVQAEVRRRAEQNRSARALRPLDVRCPRRHRVAAVYIVPGYGRVLEAVVGSTESTDEWVATTMTDTDEHGQEREIDARQHGERFVNRGAGTIAVMLDRASDEGLLQVQCRCRTTDLDLDQVHGWLSDGRAQVRLG